MRDKYGIYITTPFRKALSASSVVLIVVSILFQPFAQISYAATGVPKILNYQGRLLTSTGTLLGGTGTQYCFKFSFYDNATVGSGTKLWPSSAPSTMTATVRNGVFTVGIGDTNAGGDVLDYNFQDSDTTYINVEVATKVGPTCASGDGAESFENLSPRQRISSSGYAINSGTVGGYTAAQLLSSSFATSSADFWKSQNNFFSTTSVEYWKSGINFFSTSSTDYWKSQTDLFSTSSSDFFITQRSFFSTSSVNYWKSITDFFSTTSAEYFVSIRNIFSTTSADYYADASSTIAKTYTSNSFTMKQVFTDASTTNITADYASSTRGVFGSLSVGNFTGFLKAVAGVVTSALVNLATDVTGVLAITNGGTGTSTTPVYGRLLVGNAAGGYDLVATSSLGIVSAVWGNISGLLSNQSDLQAALDSKFSLNAWYATSTDALVEGTLNKYYTDARVGTYLSSVDKSYFFSTSSADYLATQRNFFSTTSTDYYLSQANLSAFSTTSADFWKNQRNFFSTSSADYLLTTYDKGFFFSTTSADAYLAQQSLFATTSAEYWKSYTSFFSTTSADYLAAQRGYFATSSTDFFVSQRNFFSTSSTDYWKTVTDLFSTTSANYFVNSSSTIAKTYAANSFTAKQTFLDASTTNLSSVYATSTSGYFGALSVGALNGILRATGGSISTGLVNAVSEISGVLGVGNGGTGTSTTPVLGTLLVGNAVGGYDLLSTSSLALSTGDLVEGGNLFFTDGRVQSYLDTIDKGYYFSTSSTDYYISQANLSAFSTTSADYWKDQRNFFSTSQLNPVPFPIHPN